MGKKAKVLQPSIALFKDFPDKHGVGMALNHIPNSMDHDGVISGCDGSVTVDCC